MKKILILLLTIFFSATIFVQTTISKEIDEVVQLMYTSDIEQNMNNSQYWISKLSNPNKIILTNEQIQEFNEKMFKLDVGLVKLEEYQEKIKVKKLNKEIKNRFKLFEGREYIYSSLKKVPQEFFKDIEKNINKKYKDKYKHVYYAIVLKRSDIRILPTTKPIFTSKSSLDIDRLQEESLDIGTPVIVLCTTIDKKWAYIVSNREIGWIQTENLAFTQKQDFINWINTEQKVVITSLKTNIYTDSNMKDIAVSSKMGTFLPLVKELENKVLIKYPAKDNDNNLIIKKGYVYKKDINVGPLAYTQRNVLIQAFKHIDTRYGWGGINGDRDCSGLISQVFNCFGFVLPETSTNKSKCGEFFSFANTDDNKTKETKLINNAIAGITFVYLPGHIMLYIGNNDNKPYVLHSIYGISSPDDQEQKYSIFINKTIVSSLDIGEKITNNSLIKRIKSFAIIK